MSTLILVFVNRKLCLLIEFVPYLISQLIEHLTILLNNFSASNRMEFIIKINRSYWLCRPFVLGNAANTKTYYGYVLFINYIHYVIRSTGNGKHNGNT